MAMGCRQLCCHTGSRASSLSVFMKGFGLQLKRINPCFQILQRKTHKTTPPNFLYRIVKTNSLSCNQNMIMIRWLFRSDVKKMKKQTGINTHCRANQSLSLSLWASIGLPQWLRGKESACNAGNLGSIPDLERFPGGGHGNPLQYSCLENPMDRGTWQAIQSIVSHRVGHD